MPNTHHTQYDEAAWNVALVARGAHAEERFRAGQPLTEEDIAVMALLHPDKFEIQVRQREAT